MLGAQANSIEDRRMRVNREMHAFAAVMGGPIRGPSHQNRYSRNGFGNQPVPAISRSARAASSVFFSFCHERFAGASLASMIAARIASRPMRLKKFSAV